MTKKDYEAIAKVFRNRRERHSEIYSDNPAHQVVAYSELYVTELEIADVLHEDNPRFSRSRFLAACRGEDSKDSAGRTVKYASL